jgi:glutathione-independent formaldehyde dehydrogenase
MKAVAWRGDRTLAIETVEDASLEAPTDVLMRITSTAICGTDLHIYEGRMGEVDGMVIGHKPLGMVEEIGSAQRSSVKE